MRSLRAILPIFALVVAAPALARQAGSIEAGTIMPGAGPTTTVTGGGAGRLLEADNAEDAARRQGLKPVTFLASRMIGVDVHNPAGGYVGKIDDLLIADGGTLKAVVIDVHRLFGLDDKRIAVEPSALILRPGGDRFSAVLDMGTDAIAAAAPFDPARARAMH